MTEAVIPEPEPVKTRRRGDLSWMDADDKELLTWRICDLDLRIEGSALEARVDTLHRNLADKGIHFRPACYLSTEWLCPDLVPLIGIPFCLAHPRLEHLERTMMLEVEGGTEKECLQLLRHEAGHAINYAHRLYRRRRWRELFGPMSADYDPHTYYQTPYSRQYVLHLRDYYAQAHPDEDFAETFATWLTPGLDWRKRYAGWGALRKLDYVDHLMRDLGGKPPPLTGGQRLWPAAQVRSTLESYYRKKRRDFAEAYPGYYDPVLSELFAPGPRDGAEKAHVFLARHRRSLIHMVARWAPVRKCAVDDVLRRLGKRAKEMNLHLREKEGDALMHTAVCLTTLSIEAAASRKRAVEPEGTT